MAIFDLGTGGNAFPFDNIGDSVTGKILDLEEVQQTDMETGEPLTWPNGKPKMMFRLTLQTDLREDDADDGVRTIYLRGSRKSSSKSSLAAALDAVKRATGSTQMQTGATYTHTYIGDGVPTRRGYNPPKLYEAVYVPPSVDLDNAQAPAAPATVPQQKAKAPVPAAPSRQEPESKFTPEQLAALQAAGINPADLSA